MEQAWRLFDELLLAFAFGVPLAIGMLLVLARRRVARGWPAAVARTASLLDVALVASGVLVGYLTLTPKAGPTELSLLALADVVAAAHASTAMIQVGGNLLLLAVVGAISSLRFESMRRLPRMVLTGLVLSFGIEFLQFALRLGRVASVDDVVLNTIGFTLGAAVALHIVGMPSRGADPKPRPRALGLRGDDVRNR